MDELSDAAEAALVGEARDKNIAVKMKSKPGLTRQFLSKISPFDKPEHYHQYCNNPLPLFKNETADEDCWLYNLSDLNQENEYVHQKLFEWVEDYLVKGFNVDGLRIDTCPYVPKWFWTDF